MIFLMSRDEFIERVNQFVRRVAKKYVPPKTTGIPEYPVIKVTEEKFRTNSSFNRITR